MTEISKGTVSFLPELEYLSQEKYKKLPDEKQLKNFIEIIKKPYKSRNVNDIARLMSYILSNYTLFNKLRQIPDFEENSKKNIHNFSLCLNHQVLQKNRIVYRFGDKGGKFFVLLKGEITKLAPKKIKKKMTNEEYIIYLIGLRKQEEYELIRRCLEINLSVYSFQNIGFENWLRFKNVKLEESMLIPFTHNDLKKELVNLMNNNEKSNDRIAISYEYPYRPFSYTDHNYNLSRSEFILYQYEILEKLTPNSVFGDFPFKQTEIKRNITLITETECELAVVTNEYYNSFMKEVFQQERSYFIEKLIESNKIFEGYFRSEKDLVFSKNFTLKKLRLGERLFLENDTNTNLYFIKRGTILLSFNKNYEEINEIYSIYNPNKDKFLDFVPTDSKVSIKVLNYIQGDALGLSDIVNNEMNLFTGVCSSNVVELIVINKKIFSSFYDSSDTIQENIKNFTSNKRKLINERLKNSKSTINQMLSSICSKKLSPPKNSSSKKDEINRNSVLKNILKKSNLLKDYLNYKNLNSEEKKEEDVLEFLNQPISSVKTRSRNLISSADKSSFDKTNNDNYELNVMKTLQSKYIIDRSFYLKNLIAKKSESGIIKIKKKQYDRKFHEKPKNSDIEHYQTNSQISPTIKKTHENCIEALKKKMKLKKYDFPSQRNAFSSLSNKITEDYSIQGIGIFSINNRLSYF